MTDLALDHTWFQFPVIDPIAIAIGPLVIRWYALSYMAGLLGGWQILRRLAKNPNSPVSALQLDSLLNYVLLGVIAGGRLGYVIFYKPLIYISDPLSIFKIWEGGMSFHGGFIGVVVAVALFAHAQKQPESLPWHAPHKPQWASKAETLNTFHRKTQTTCVEPTSVKYLSCQLATSNAAQEHPLYF